MTYNEGPRSHFGYFGAHQIFKGVSSQHVLLVFLMPVPVVVCSIKRVASSAAEPLWHSAQGSGGVIRS